MGVPRFFKWISERYPCIVSPFTDATIPSIDNLYLDMNGIVHVCTHNNAAPTIVQSTTGSGTSISTPYVMTEREAVYKIFEYIDKLFNKIKPKKHFFMAIDGVAPRAKMNQQRQRRFRSAQDGEKTRKKLAKDYNMKEDHLDQMFDSNCITPGTEFMHSLSVHLQYFIRRKMQQDLDWQSCNVIFSGHDVPGEGEHKIMEFIRGRKSQTGYSPNETHCLYGLDADLIMLGLMTHEPHFMLLREDVLGRHNFANKNKPQNKPLEQKLHLLHLSLLREYFDLEFSELKSKLNFKYDLERIIDDFILMCFFCGNDFLPHMPTLDIGEGAIAILFDSYKAVLPTFDGYMTKTLDGTIYWNRVEQFLKLIAKRENAILEERFHNVVSDKRRSRRRGNNSHTFNISRKDLEKKIKDAQLSNQQSETKEKPDASLNIDEHLENEFSQIGLDNTPTVTDNQLESPSPYKNYEDNDDDDDEMNDNNDRLKAAGSVLTSSTGEKEPAIDPNEVDPLIQMLLKEEENELIGDEEEDEDEEDASINNILLQSIGEDKCFNFGRWHQIYYINKFQIKNDDPQALELQSIVKAYIEGIAWAFNYYCDKCVSWKWFYPYHYSPIASDLINLSEIASTIDFHLGEPFLPFQQLLGVLPPKSMKLLPKPYQKLLSSESPIGDFYPSELKIDREGTKYEYEGTVLLPFINEERLLDAINKIEKQIPLTKEEMQRNRFGSPFLFTYNENLTPYSFSSPLPEHFKDIKDCKVSCEEFEMPKAENGSRFCCTLVKGVKMGLEGLENFPTLITHPFSIKILEIGVQLYATPSKKPTIVLKLEPPFANAHIDMPVDDNGIISSTSIQNNEELNKEEEDNEEKAYVTASSLKHLIGQKVYIGFPYPRLAIVTSVADQKQSIYGNSVDDHTKENEKEFCKEVEYHKQILLRRFGIDIGRTDVIMYVKLFKGMTRDENGNIRRAFYKEEFAYPYQLLIPSTYRPIPDPKFKETKSASKIAMEFEIGRKVVYLGKEHYGRTAKVSSHSMSGIRITLDPIADNFLKFQVPSSAKKYFSQAYYALRDVPFQLGLNLNILSTKVIGRIIGRVNLFSSSGDKYDIGLNLRNTSANKRVVGYTRCMFNEQTQDEMYFYNTGTGNSRDRPQVSSFSVHSHSGWELSDKAITLIGDYFNKFPEIFKKLSTSMNTNEIKDLWPGNEKEGIKYVKRVQEFINSQNLKDLAFLGVDSDLLPDDVIQMLEQSMIEMCNTASLTPSDADSSAQRSIDVYRSNLVYRPPDPFPPVHREHFDVGHRVVSISAAGQVPFGNRGVIIGIQGLTAQVLFDEEFVGGTTFGDKLKTFRGATVPMNQLLDLTNPQYVIIKHEAPPFDKGKQVTTHHKTYKHHYYSNDYSSHAPRAYVKQNPSKSPSSPVVSTYTTPSHHRLDQGSWNRQQIGETSNKKPKGNKKGNASVNTFAVLNEMQVGGSTELEPKSIRSKKSTENIRLLQRGENYVKQESPVEAREIAFEMEEESMNAGDENDLASYFLKIHKEHKEHKEMLNQSNPANKMANVKSKQSQSKLPKTPKTDKTFTKYSYPSYGDGNNRGERQGSYGMDHYAENQNATHPQQQREQQQQQRFYHQQPYMYASQDHQQQHLRPRLLSPQLIALNQPQQQQQQPPPQFPQQEYQNQHYQNYQSNQQQMNEQHSSPSQKPKKNKKKPKSKTQEQK